MFNKFYAFLCKLSCEFWWPLWSNIRFKNAIHENIGIQEEDKVEKLADIKSEVVKLYQKFKWTADDVTQLFDAMTPPPQNYKYYLDGLLKDDCDGFHALVYHVLRNNRIKCYLLAVCAPSSGHCVLLFEYDNKWYVNDYSRVYEAHDNPIDAIKDYNKQFEKIYRTSEVVYNCCEEYDYETGKYYSVTIDKIK